MFGLPKTRQYPMPDKAHVIKAIQFFKYCDDKDKPELAKNINRRAKELKMQIKVQPSSAFYKYADKSILKEAMMVQEFHIGQLAPIVTLEPQIIKMNFGNGKIEDNDGPIERLNKLWGSNKSIDEKTSGTADVVQEAIRNGYKFNSIDISILEGIDALGYMLSPRSSDSEIELLSDRIYDRTNTSYDKIQEFIDTHKLDDIVNSMNAMSSKTEYACTLAIINYTTSLSDYEKDYIYNHLNNRHDMQNIVFPNKSINKLETVNVPVKVNMTDDDIFHIDQFMNMLPSPGSLTNIGFNIATKRFGDTIVFHNMGNISYTHDSAMSQLRYIDLTEKIPTSGYYRKFSSDNNRFLDFFKIGTRLYYATQVSCTTETHILMICIYDYTNEEYGMSMLSYALGADPTFKIITRVISFKRKKHPTIEASDFKDVYNGIQISTNGNVSFLMDELEPWQSKYDLCKQMLDRNMKDKEYEHFKSNLCALFSMILLIYNKYNPTLMVDSQEAKSALNVMDKSMTLFKDSYDAINKIHPEYNFIDHYLAVHYNNLLNVFGNLEGKELRNEVTLSFNWIMNH